MTPSGEPARIGDFAVLRTLGQGGMGCVYACWDEALEREVAIKVLLPELAVQPEMAERFLREARAMAKVRSPHVVSVHQVGESPEGPYLVMELLDGEDLGRRIRREGRLPFDKIVVFLKDSVAGLKTAAAAGLVHRDVKPENLFIQGERIKLTDFGLARPLDGSKNLTQAGLVVGSPHYLAPELARGQDASQKSDLYALGCTLYEMLAGQPPFDGGTAVEVITAHLTSTAADVTTLRPDTPADLAELCRRLIAKEPEQRVGSYEAVEAVLDRLASPPGITAATQIGLGVPTSSEASAEAPKTPRQSLPHPSAGFAAVKTDTLSVMFTDIAGYTERTGTQSREEAAYWLELHDALLRPVFRAFAGTVVKTIGDAFLVTFKSPTDAVHCGCAIQDRLFAHNETAAEDDRIRVRVAISAGEVRLRKGDVLGEPVNLAARLEKLAQPGDVVFSDAVYAIMNTAEVPADDLGEHTFKGIGRQVRVYGARKAETGPPFSGRALANVKDGGLLPALDVAKRRIAGALDQVSEGIGVVARRPPRRAVMAAGVVIAVALVVTGAGYGLKALFGTPPPKDDDPIQLWAIKDLVAYLPDGNIDDIMAELARRDPDDLEDPLDEVIEKGNWPARHHALEVLERVKLATPERQQKVALRDFLEGGDCKARKAGLYMLRKVAADDDALDALDKAREGSEHGCVSAALWEESRALIQKKLAED